MTAQRSSSVNRLVRSDEWMAMLHRNALELCKVKDIEDIARTILDSMEQALGYEIADFIIVEGGYLRVIGWRGNALSVLRLSLDGPGLVVKAAKTKRPVMVPDVREEEAYVDARAVGEGGAELEILSELAVPVIIDDMVVAVLNVESTRLNAYTEEDRMMLETLASHTAAAINRLRQITELEEREEKLAALHYSARNFQLANSVDDIAAQALDSIKKVLGFNLGSFAVVEGDFLYYILIQGIEIEEPFKMPLDGPGITVRAARTGQTQLVTDTRMDEDFVQGPAKGISESLSELAVPVKVNDKVVAVLNEESEQLNAFTEQDQMLMEMLAAHISAAYQRLRQLLERREYEARLEDLYENSPVMHCSLDPEGSMIKINKTMAEALGYSKGELMGRKITSIMTDAGVEAYEEAYPKLLKSGEIHGVERQLIRSDGSIIVTLVDVSVEYDDEGRPLYTRAVFNDITQRSRAERERRELVYRLNDVKPGGCYLSESHERCLKAYADLSMHGVPGLCIVREDPEKLVERYGLQPEEVMLLSSRPLKGFKALPDLQAVSRAISQNLEAGGGVVLLDGIEYLITRFGFEAVFSFIQERRFDFLEVNSIFLIPLYPATLTQRENALLVSELITLE